MVYRSLPNSWSQSIPIVRPLLNIWREEISAYLVEHDLLPNLDQSNLDIRFYRNRLRQEVIPFLESIQPALRKNLWQTAEILGEDLAVLEDLIEEAWEKCVVVEGPGYLALSPYNLKEQPLGLRRHLFRRGIDRLRPGLRDLGFQAIERAVQFLNEPSHHGRMDLVAGIFLYFEKQGTLSKLPMKTGRGGTEIASQSALPKSHPETEECLWMATWEADLPNIQWPQIPYSQVIKMDIPGEIRLPGNWRIVAEIVNCSDAVLHEVFNNTDPFQAWLDLESLELPLEVRARLPGDRLHPLGMQGRAVKITDLMINIKLPRRARQRWPLLLSGEEVAWVPGTRIDQRFQITEKTEGILKVRITSCG
jgi:tRNA(Ile)-lysidine synthase